MPRAPRNVDTGEFALDPLCWCGHWRSQHGAQGFICRGHLWLGQQEPCRCWGFRGPDTPNE